MASVAASVKTDEVEITADSDSIANVWPPEFGIEFGFVGETPSSLRDVQFAPLMCFAVREVTLQWMTDKGGWMPASIKFDVANVAQHGTMGYTGSLPRAP